VRAAVAALLLVPALGCASIDLVALPPEPIAFVYRSIEQGRRRAELVDADVAKDAEITDQSYVRAQRILDFLTGATEERKLAETYGRISLLDPRTLEVRPVPGASGIARPNEWSPDHRRLVFTMTWERKPQVFESQIDGTQLSRLTHGHEPHASASLLPDGRMAFTRVTGTGKEARARIWVTDAGGLNPRVLTDGPYDSRPRWVPDGSAVLFATELAGRSSAIARVSPKGEGPPRIIARGREHSITRDGAWVVFSAEHQGRWRLWRMRPDGTGKGEIGGGTSVQTFDEVHPTISPDGQYIAYVSFEGGRERLRIRRFDGKGDRPLLEAADGTVPVW
jgi:Tol biopolymer transport system component